MAAADFLEAEHTGSGLVEALDKRDVETRAYAAEREVHVRHTPGVAAVEDDAAAVKGPGRAVCGVGGCIDVGAGIFPLRGGSGEGVAAPGGFEHAEMGGCRACEGEEGEEGGGKHGCGGSRVW